MTNVTCSECGQPEDMNVDPATGKFRRELRPYGRGGAPICHPCATGTPAAEARTKRQFHESLDRAGDVAVIGVGQPPRPATTEERRRLIRSVKRGKKRR